MKTPTRVALVTGGSRGIGLGICRALAAEGFALAVNGVRAEEDVKTVLSELADLSPAVLYCRGDVSEKLDRQRIVETVHDRFGRLDVLVNNAGIAPAVRADLLEASEESYDRLMSVNVRGPYFLTQRVAGWMSEQATGDAGFRGCIVNVTSVSATVASVNRGEYCLSKAAMSMATKLWAVRMAEFGIPVYEVRPGIIRTDMTAGVTEKYDQLIARGLTLEPRWGTPEDVGRAVAMLTRGDLPYATGAVLTLDGGMSVDRL
jgi:3-oxoacyl-[acyl-carrier protein] reductase